MEEKKSIKISLSTVFLILAISAICIMGYFLYTSNIKANDMIAKEKEFNAKIAKLEDDLAIKQTQISAIDENINSKEVKNSNNLTNSTTVENRLTFSSLSGMYIGDAKVEPGTTTDEETEVRLFLYEDGSFSYNNHSGLAAGIVGYYTFNENDIILHEVLKCANDIGRSITSDTMTLKINKDNSITDNKLNAVLKKTSQKIESKTNCISEELKNALNNNSLYN